jgi:sugar phosphate isomerase/epimerase
MHFGMQPLVEYSSLEQSLSLCAELGLDFIELNMNLPEYQLDQIDVTNVKQLFQYYGKYPTIHLDDNLNVCDFNSAVSNAYFDTVLKTITLAKDLNAPIINMHMADGVYFTLPDKKVYLFEKHKQKYHDRLQQFRDACAMEIGDSKILICIENCGIYHVFQQESIDFLLGSSCFALTYDIGHDFCIGNGNQTFIMNRAERLKHLHLHDAEEMRNHLPLGTGAIDIVEKIALAKKINCRCVLETKTADALRQSVKYLRNISKTVEVP